MSQEIVSAHKLQHKCPAFPPSGSNMDSTDPLSSLDIQPSKGILRLFLIAFHLWVKEVCPNRLFKMNTEYE